MLYVVKIFLQYKVNIVCLVYLCKRIICKVMQGKKDNEIYYRLNEGLHSLKMENIKELRQR